MCTEMNRQCFTTGFLVSTGQYPTLPNLAAKVSGWKHKSHYDRRCPVSPHLKNLSDLIASKPFTPFAPITMALDRIPQTSVYLNYLYILSICNLKIQNQICSQIPNFLKCHYDATSGFHI